MDMVPQIVLSCVMGVIVYCVQFIDLHDVLTLIIQILLGMLVYIGRSVLLKLESFTYVWNIVKKYLKRGGK